MQTDTFPLQENVYNIGAFRQKKVPILLLPRVLHPKELLTLGTNYLDSS